ncbi:MlaC/ttg2D family ABC transporter substrate-binding protein [Candidatus Vondammii sp. HM_W22]|uniref:MlaC/ttg2D family ABC transporter substrate-binding protein n=1 Tax=Candidatus Vondammii sp. HM_W22 TaxID=2687299 RepID=UPI001F1336C3|nr:ABC transporter substrate-binding protein [Candidatus Vondammii sp. HM_W22]
MNKWAPYFGLLLLPLFLVRPVMADNAPDAVVKETADLVLAEVVLLKKELNQSPEKIYQLVEHIVLPRFDFLRMSRLVLGKYWKRAKESEKEAFIGAFRELLIRTYTMALLNYSGQKIEYLPFRHIGNATNVTVSTRVSESGAIPVPINYKLYLDEDGWKVYDVVIDGVSLVSNYRTSFSSRIRRYKLSGLIRKLELRNKQGK